MPMELDYLEEIKIETRPRSRREIAGKNAGSGRFRTGRRERISLDSVKDKKLLIEGLRQKEKEEAVDLGLSLTDIESLKKQIQEDRRSRSAELIATRSEMPVAADLTTAAGPEFTEVEPAEPAAVPVQQIEPVLAESSPVMPSPSEPSPVVRNASLGNQVLLRYLIKELFLYFAICFAFFFVVFFVNQILLMAETILRQRVPVHNVIRLIAYSLPSIIAQSAPFATLVGFLMCVGRMATDNEVLIMRASGLRYSFIALPVLLMGLLISFAGFAMNDYFLPLGILKYNRLRKQIIQSDPAVEIEANSVKRMNGTTLVIGGVDEDGSIGDLVIFDKDSTNRDRVIITGRSEVSKSDEPGILMQFNMSGSTVLEVDRTHKGNFDVFESQKILLNVFDSVLLPSEGIQPREMTSFDLWKIIQIMKKDASVTHKMMNRYNLEFAKKFSLPFGSIFFAMLAFPLSLIFGKRDGQTLGMIFGIIISVIYWAATILGQMFGVRSGWNGFWMMWGPNFFIGLVGLLLYVALRKK